MGNEHRWVLCDVSKRIWMEHFSLGPDDLILDTDMTWGIWKRSLRGGLSDGVDIIRLNNGCFSITVVPTRGMGIWKAKYRGIPVGWQSPVRGPVNPRNISLQDRGGLGWLQGFDELIVRCGLDWTGGPGMDIAPNNMGEPVETPHTLHGRIANLPASYVEVGVDAGVNGEPPTLWVRGMVEESAIFLPQFQLRTTISTKLGSNRVTIEDEIVNLRSLPAEFELLYHCNFGRPFLEQGAELLVPSKLLAPRDPHAAEESATSAVYGGPVSGYVERCYWYEPLGDAHGNSLAMLRNRAGNKAAVVRFNVRELPCFTQWKNIGAESDGYVTGLEPGTDYPNPKPFEREQGRLLSIPAYGSYPSTVVLEVLDSAEQVAAATAEVAAIQGQTPCRAEAGPLPTHTPGL